MSIFEMRPLFCLETSGSDYGSMELRIKKYRNFQLRFRENSTTRTDVFSFCVILGIKVNRWTLVQ